MVANAHCSTNGSWPKGAIIIGITVTCLGLGNLCIRPIQRLRGRRGWLGISQCRLADPTAIAFVGLPEEQWVQHFLPRGCGGEGATVGAFLMVMITFVDIFDTAGTLYSVGRQAEYVDENINYKSDEAFMSDAAATIIGAALGTSTTTTYIESSQVSKTVERQALQQ